MSNLAPSLKALGQLLGIEILESCNRFYAVDVVGEITDELRERIEGFRAPGVYVRYFASHKTRLAEFQSRLDRTVRKYG